MRAPASLDAIVLSCEHGGNHIPAAYARLFESRASQRALQSHRGWDPGALEVARHLRRILKAPLVFSRVSRLLIDLNRSEGHADSFSQFSKGLDPAARHRVQSKHYWPHRRRVEQEIQAGVSAGRRVVHIAIHSFTAKLGGVTRNADIGLLYDPKRLGEKALCASWRSDLHRRAPQLRLRSNYPYRGTSDGLSTALRKGYSASCYLGIELELNQGLLATPGLDKAELAQWLATSLRGAQSGY